MAMRMRRQSRSTDTGASGSTGTSSVGLSPESSPVPASLSVDQALERAREKQATLAVAVPSDEQPAPGEEQPAVH